MRSFNFWFIFEKLRYIDDGDIYLLTSCCFYFLFIFGTNARSINFSLPTVPTVVHPPLPGKFLFLLIEIIIYEQRVSIFKMIKNKKMIKLKFFTFYFFF